MSAIGALAYRRDASAARVFVGFRRGEVHDEDIVQFLAHLSRHVAGRMVIVWDGLQAHRAVLVRKWLERHRRVRIERLPAYAPELNAVEGLWAWCKGTLLANVCEAELAPMVGRVRKGIRRLRRREAVLWGLLAKTGLSLSPRR